MTQAYILNMANHELMSKIEKEENRIKANPSDTIASAMLERFHAEEKELHSMILEAEKANR